MCFSYLLYYGFGSWFNYISSSLCRKMNVKVHACMLAHKQTSTLSLQEHNFMCKKTNETVVLKNYWITIDSGILSMFWEWLLNNNYTLYNVNTIVINLLSVRHVSHFPINFTKKLLYIYYTCVCMCTCKL